LFQFVAVRFARKINYKLIYHKLKYRSTLVVCPKVCHWIGASGVWSCNMAYSACSLATKYSRDTLRTTTN